MNKIIAIGLVLILVFSMFFGCTQVDTNTKVTNDSEAAKTIADAGSDISGIKETLDKIDSDLTA